MLPAKRPFRAPTLYVLRAFQVVFGLNMNNCPRNMSAFHPPVRIVCSNVAGMEKEKQ